MLKSPELIQGFWFFFFLIVWFNYSSMPEQVQNYVVILGVKTGTQDFSSQTLSLSPVHLCINDDKKHLGSCH